MLATVWLSQLMSCHNPGRQKLQHVWLSQPGHRWHLHPESQFRFWVLLLAELAYSNVSHMLQAYKLIEVTK